MKSFHSVAVVVKCTTSLTPSQSILSLSHALFQSLSHPISPAKVQFATSTRRTQNWADSRLSLRAESPKNAVKNPTPFPINEHLSIKGATWPSHSHSSLLVNSCCWTKPPLLDLSLGCYIFMRSAWNCFWILFSEFRAKITYSKPQTQKKDFKRNGGIFVIYIQMDEIAKFLHYQWWFRSHEMLVRRQRWLLLLEYFHSCKHMALNICVFAAI